MHSFASSALLSHTYNISWECYKHRYMTRWLCRHCQPPTQHIKEMWSDCFIATINCSHNNNPFTTPPTSSTWHYSPSPISSWLFPEMSLLHHTMISCVSIVADLPYMFYVGLLFLLPTLKFCVKFSHWLSLIIKIVGFLFVCMRQRATKKCLLESKYSVNSASCFRNGLSVLKVAGSSPELVGSKSGQVKSKNWSVSLPSLTLTIIRIGQGLVDMDNVTEWDSRSWYWRPAVPVSQHYKVTKSAHSHK